MGQDEHSPDVDLNPVRSQRRVNKKQNVEINNPASNLVSACGSTGNPQR